MCRHWAVGSEVLKTQVRVDLLLRAVLVTASLLLRQEGAGLEGEDTDEGQRSGSRCEKLQEVQPHVVREEEMQDAQH